MRLPWPFGRSTSGAGDSTGPAGVDASVGSSGGGPAIAAAAADAPIPPTGAWRTLPPIQRSSGPPPVVAPAAPFLAEVPGHAPLPPIVTPLGHDSNPSAPAGMVVVHPHPVPSLTSHAPLPTRPVQRQAAPGAPSMTSVSAADVASSAGDLPQAMTFAAAIPAPGKPSAPTDAPPK